MVKKFSILLALGSFLICSGANGQVNPTIEYKELLSGVVSENGKSLLSPFCGGINSTQPNHVDLNMDGLNDIVIYDHNTETLKTFINVGVAGEERYMYDPKYAKNFPRINSYLKMEDYNCDNVPDLFHKGSSGYSVYRGYYNGNNELAFAYYKDLYYPGAFGPINAYVQPTDIPIIADVDNDGDMDFVSFDVLGSLAPWYKNLQVENNLPCDSIEIIVGDDCYGKMYQTFYRTHVLNASCKGGSGSGSSSNKRLRHGANCILAIDMNGDGLLDMLGGNNNYTDAQILYRGGSASNPLFVSQDTFFDAGGHQIEMFSWPAPFYFDIDNDNDKDLVFTPHYDNTNTANYNVMAVYENTGTTAMPNLVWRNDSAFVDQMIDVGRNSHPTLFDYDKDGKLDLFVGSEGYLNTLSNSKVSQLAYYKNTSTVGTVSFELITKDFLGLSSQSYPGIYPNFGDITGDGVDDLILGNDSGTIIVYNNIAPNNTSMPNFVFQTDSLPGIDVGNYSSPFIYDMNSDGKTDLLIGCEVGTFYLYEDTSTTATKEFKLINSSIGGVKAGYNFFFGFGVPYIGRVDSSSKDYLLFGSADGTIQRLDSFTNQHTNWVELDSNMAKIQTAYRSAPAIADLDGDLRPELLIGNQNGGLYLYQFVKNNNSSVSISNIDKDEVQVKLFPNPTKDALYIQASSNTKLIKAYRILDISGRTIIHNTKVQKISEQISTASLTSGLYFIEISFGNNQYAKGKFMKKY